MIAKVKYENEIFKQTLKINSNYNNQNLNLPKSLKTKFILT